MSWQEFERESTPDLIEYISWSGSREDDGVARDAFTAFIFRFRADLQHKCRVVAKNWGYDEDVGDNIAERTFHRFWKYGAKKFDFSNAASKNPEAATKLYLYGIAQKEIASYDAEQKSNNPYTGQEEILREFPTIDYSQYPVEKRGELKKRHETIQKALERLSPKHKIVYLTYASHQTQGYNLPRELLQKLRTELELTQSSIQVYKKQAYDTIKEYIDIYG